MIPAHCHTSVDIRLVRITMSRLPSQHCDSTRLSASNGHWVGRSASTVRGQRPRDRWYDQMDHPDTSGEVARPLSDIAAQSRCQIRRFEIIVAAGPEMAGKATESFWTTLCPLSTLSWDLGAKSSAASEQTASWFSGWECHACMMQALAAWRACSAKGQLDPCLGM